MQTNSLHSLLLKKIDVATVFSFCIVDCLGVVLRLFAEEDNKMDSSTSDVMYLLKCIDRAKLFFWFKKDF